MWTAALVSDLGDAVGRVALTILIQRETDSPFLVGAVAVMYAIPFLGLGQWLTAHLCRLPRRHVLVGADLLRAACFAAMVAPVGVYPRLALLLVASAATPTFQAVAGAVVARSVPERLVGQAAGLRTGTTELAFVLGFAIGGLAADLWSPVVVIGFDAMTFLLSAAIIVRSPLPEAEGAHQDRVLARHGLRLVLHDPVCRRVVLLTGAAFALVLVPETLVASFADEHFPGTDGVTGGLAALTAVGVIVATLVHRPEKHRALLRHAGLLTIGGGAVAAAAFAGPDRLGLAAIAYLAVGPVLAIRVHTYTVLSQRIDDAMLPAALSIAGGTIAGAYLFAGFVGGALADAIGTQATFLLACAGVALLGAAALVLPAAERQDSGARFMPVDEDRSIRSIS